MVTQKTEFEINQQAQAVETIPNRTPTPPSQQTTHHQDNRQDGQRERPRHLLTALTLRPTNIVHPPQSLPPSRPTTPRAPAPRPTSSPATAAIPSTDRTPTSRAVPDVKRRRFGCGVGIELCTRGSA